MSEPSNTFTQEQVQEMMATAAKAAVADALAQAVKQPHLLEDAREANDPELRALNELRAIVEKAERGKIRFSRTDAQDYVAKLPQCSVTKAWMVHYGRAPREIGTNYPVRQFGTHGVVSLCPSSDSHRTG